MYVDEVNLTSRDSELSDHQIEHSKSNGLFSKKYLIILGFLILFVVSITFVGFYLINNHTKTIQNQTSSQSASSNNTVLPIAVQTNVTYTQSQLSSITGSPSNVNALPLGDNKYTTTDPKKGYVYLCNVQQGQGGASEEGNWVHGSTWNLTQKPSVNGQVVWSNATFSNSISGNNRILSGNDLPVQVTTGIFPIASSDPAYQYDRNPNTITAHSFTLSLPLTPMYSSTPSCMGGEVGVMLNGVPLFNGFDADHRDAAAHEVQDACDGHPQESGEYHYHSLSRCIKDINETTVIGFALDGFPITGPVLPNGNYLTTNDLDECHGLSSEIVLDGKETTTYHYVMTQDFPYSVSCFRGKPVRLQVIQNLQSTLQNSGQSNSQQTGSSGMHQPPQAAITACSGKSSNATCSFSAPRGDVSGTCQKSQDQTSMICVP